MKIPLGLQSILPVLGLVLIVANALAFFFISFRVLDLEMSIVYLAMQQQQKSFKIVQIWLYKDMSL